MKKIAIFQTDLNMGGIEKSLVNLLNNIEYTNIKVDLYLFEEAGVFLDDIPNNVNIIYLKKGKYINRFIYFNLLKIFYKNKIDEEYDIAIDYNSYSMDTALATISCKAKTKIAWVHNDMVIKKQCEFKYRVLYHFFKGKFKYYNKYVAVSKGALDSFKKLNNYNNKEYIVMPNIIDTKEIVNKIKEKNKLELDKDKINICSVGRLVHQKGFDILLNNIKELTNIREDFHLYIIGDGELSINLQNQVNDLELNEYVTLLGYEMNPYSIMNDMDAFVLTSRYEGQGIVFLEAYYLGLEVVIPNHLTKYVDYVKGTNDVVKSLSKLEKKNSKFNSLDEYNKKIIDTFKRL